MDEEMETDLSQITQLVSSGAGIRDSLSQSGSGLHALAALQYCLCIHGEHLDP